MVYELAHGLPFCRSVSGDGGGGMSPPRTTAGAPCKPCRNQEKKAKVAVVNLMIVGSKSSLP